MSKLDEFLAGERPDDVALFLSEETLDEEGRLAERGEAVDGGVVLVVPGDKGRRLFSAGTGVGAMEFAQSASGTEGTIDPDLAGGTCPAAENLEDVEGEAEADEPHHVTFVLAFAEAQNEEAGGLYAEGDIVHAYAACECGERYSQRWVVGERET